VLDAVMVDAVEAYAAVVRDALADAASDERGEPTTALRLAVAGSTQVALDRPALLVAYLREHHRIGHGALTELVGADREQFALWTRAIEAVRPDVGKGEQAARLQACLGALVGMSIASGKVDGVDPGGLVGSGILAMLEAPPDPRFRPAAVPTPSGWTPPPSRRQQLLWSAVELFKDEGYDGVGIDDLGAAVGISGPAVYAWFDTKAQILVDLFDLMVSRLAAVCATAIRTASTPSDALGILVRGQVQVSFDSADLMLVANRELHALPREDQRRMARRRIDLREPWRAILAEVRPDLTPEEHLVLIECVLHLVRQVSQYRQASGPSVDATASLALAFLLDSNAVRT